MGYFEAFLGVDLWTALFVLLNTLLLFWVLKKYLFKPVTRMIDDRQKEIDDMYAEAGAAKNNACSLQREYEQKLSAAQQTGERIVKEAVARGQSREEAIVRQANAEASAILERASADIAQEKKKAINDAKNEISDMALAIAGKVVGRQLTQEDQSRLVEQFIEELGEQP